MDAVDSSSAGRRRLRRLHTSLISPFPTPPTALSPQPRHTSRLRLLSLFSRYSPAHSRPTAGHSCPAQSLPALITRVVGLKPYHERACSVSYWFSCLVGLSHGRVLRHRLRETGWSQRGRLSTKSGLAQSSLGAPRAIACTCSLHT